MERSPEIADGTAQLRVQLLGALRVDGPLGELHLASGKVRGLLGLLALHGGAPQTRELLAEYLWPEAAPERGRHNLANTLYSLRQILGSAWLITQGDRVALRAEAGLWVDVWEFTQLCATGDDAALERAVALYGGELLPELFDEWVLPERAALHEHYRAALRHLGLAAEQQQQHNTAYDYYQRLVRTDPLDEAATRGLMRSLACLGRLPDALAAYGDLERALSELGIGSDTATRSLLQQLRHAESHQVAGRSAGHPVPFVGRRAERSLLLARLEEARSGRGGVVVLLGEAGSGKTRLLEELAHAANWRGWQVAWGHGQEFALPPPYTPLRQALAAALPAPRLEQLAQLIQPLWLTMAAALVPELAEQLGRSPWPQQVHELGRLPTAVRHVLYGLQRIAPHLLLLDDMHWADPAVWALLEHLRQPLASMALLLVVSGRSEDLRTDALAWAAVQNWDTAGVPLIHLAGLNTSELADLAAAHGMGSFSAAELAYLSRASGGNPLLALALFQAGEFAQGESPTQPSLVALMQRRLADLSPQAQRVLEAAAVLGYHFRYNAWQLLDVGQGMGELPALAATLEQARLLQLESDGYRFTHDTLRGYVYAHMPAERRRDLHRQALAALTQQSPGDHMALLHHAEQAGDNAAVARHAFAAGEQALAGCAFQAALRLFTLALDAQHPNDGPGRYRALLGRLRALEVLGDTTGQRRDLDVLHNLAEQLGDPQRRAEVAQHWASLCCLTGAWSQARAHAANTLALAQQSGDVWRQARALELLSRVAQSQGDYRQAQELLAQAQALYRSISDPSGEATSTHNLAILAWLLGDYARAISQYRDAIQIFHELGELFQEARALNSLGCALWSLGDYMQSRATHERALAMSRELSDRWGEDANTLNLGHVALALGDYVTAIECFDTALASFQAGNNQAGCAVSLSNLSSAYRQLGDIPSALRYGSQALERSQAIGQRRIAGYAQHNCGLALLASGRHTEACAALIQACAIRADLGERDTLLESQAGLALAELAAGEHQRAGTTIALALAALDARSERAILRQWVYYAAYVVLDAQGAAADARVYLRNAMAAMAEAAAALPPDARQHFLADVPLNRDIQTALEGANMQIQVLLAKLAVPLGRKLTASDYIAVRWTISAPDDDTLADPGLRRHHVLRRLITEANAQGAAPTDDDLATALGVSRRTVLRDIKQLAAQGHILATRRRAPR